MCDTSPDTSQDALNVKMLMLLIRSLPYVDTNPDLHRIGGDELQEEIRSFLKGLKPMYTNGELEEVMKSFEKTLKVAPVYAGGGTDRADKVEVTLESGRISKQYRNNNYYNDGHINQFFILFLHGYAAGKCVGLSEQ